MAHHWHSRIQVGPLYFEDLGHRQNHQSDELYLVPTRTFRQLVEEPLLGGLAATGAGIFHQSLGHEVNRPRGFPAHSLQLILSGSGMFSIGGRQIFIRGPALVWITGREPHHYRASEKDPWTIAHLSCMGPFMDIFHRRFGLGAHENPLPLNWTPQVLSLIDVCFSEVRRAFRESPPDRRALSTSATLRVALFKILEVWESQPRPARHGNSLTRYMTDHLMENLTVAHMARSFAMKPREFSVWVKAATGKAPLHHLAKIRVDTARAFLAQGMPVHEVAQRVGYQDALYFSRVYRKVTGRSPRQDRPPRGARGKAYWAGSGT